MKIAKLIIVPIVALAPALAGCGGDKAKETGGQDAVQDASADAGTDEKNPDELPEDVQKKLKSLGYIQ